MVIREALNSERDIVLSVERAAFGSSEEANLVSDLLDDATAQPLLSLLAFREVRPVGHILFTRALLVPEPQSPLNLSILAPLAVLPEDQKQGIGGQLIEQGLEMLLDTGVDLVFVLGYPDYYIRHGFKPAGVLGFDASYPIAPGNADAWMVRALRPGVVGHYRGRVMCAEALNKPEYWVE
ncbi:MAG: N-acetyltransferase [Gammaproteobacteria bacterium]|nr:N-acetyltransferase [Gammaproteobacteria bacterium]